MAGLGFGEEEYSVAPLSTFDRRREYDRRRRAIEHELGHYTQSQQYKLSIPSEWVSDSLTISRVPHTSCHYSRKASSLTSQSSGNSTQRAAIDPCRECEAEGINGSLACQVMEECEQIHEERKAQAEAIERLAPEITSPVSSVPHSATQLPNIVENFDLNALHDSLVQAAADSEHCLATCEHAKAAREFQQELLTLQEDLKLLESDSRAKSANLEELEQQLATCRRTFIQKLQVIERLEYTVKEQAARIASLEQQARHIAENSAEIQNTSQPAAGSVTNTVALENSDQTQSTPVQQSRAPSLMTGTVTRLASLANSLFEKIPIPTSILQRGLQLALDLDSRH